MKSKGLASLCLNLNRYVLNIMQYSDAASGWAGWNLGVQLTLLQPGGQIMPNTLLLAHPDLKT